MLAVLLNDLIKQITNQKRNDIELLLIDNNSTDNTKSIVNNLKKDYEFLKYNFEPRQGLAKARNKGLTLIKSKIVAFIDDDITLHRDWLSEVLKSTELYPYKAFGGKIIPKWEKEKPYYINFNGYFSISQKIFPSHDNGDKEKKYPITKEETNPIGANMWLHKEVFDKYGFFREDLGRVGYGGIPCEDTEFCQRLLRNKEAIFYYPKAIVYHPVSTFRMSKEYIKSWHYRNGISVVRKGNRKFSFLDPLRFLIRLFVFIPYYFLFSIAGNILFNKFVASWALFKLIRITGQLREFLRIWFRLPLKDPIY